MTTANDIFDKDFQILQGMKFKLKSDFDYIGGSKVCEEKALIVSAYAKAVLAQTAIMNTTGVDNKILRSVDPI